MKLTKMILANAIAATTAILWIVCGLFIWLLPDFSLKVSRWWAMGLNIDPLGTFNLGWADFLWGGVAAIIAAWIGGYILGWSIEYFGKGK